MPRHQARPVTADARHMSCPIARLPNEIIHQIFSLLDTPQVASLRLACRTFSTIGLQYLASTIHLLFKPSSFANLRLISEHPVLSRHVHTLFYEADSLDDVYSMKEWKQKIIVPEWFKNIHSKPIPAPPLDASDREERAYRRHMEKARTAPQYIYSARRLKKAYEEYMHFLWVQKHIRQHDYNSEMIRDAMAKLPKLKTIELSLFYCLHSRSRKMENAFAEGLSVAYGDQGDKPCGVVQLRSLLLGASDAGLEIETLRCGVVQWSFFIAPDVLFDKVKHAVRCLRTLEFYITIRRRDEDREPDEVEFDLEELELCADYLEESGALRDFLTSAPKLENLMVQFDFNAPVIAARLSDLVGDFSWHSLRLAAFSMISTSEEELMTFYERHATTLREIRIESIHLTHGSWNRVFVRIRDTLSLEKATVCGYITIRDTPDFIDFDETPYIGTLIEMYLVGDCDPMELLRKSIKMLKD